jgi:hypothetical protein
MFVAVSPRLRGTRGPRQAARTWTHGVCLVTPGSENMANDHKGSPGTWETLLSPSIKPGWGPVTISRMIPQPRVLGWGGRTQGRNRWYRQAKETKRGESETRESERLVVPPSQGNCPEGPWGGKGTPSSLTVGGKHDRDIGP